ncbi:MAG: hypothetical protein H6Q15_2254 [Bacteroidetes bacterium]|nr:hypothetical protein [Bacteroidota bacterium]
MMDSKEEVIIKIDTFYRIISGEKTTSRDWIKFKELFYEDATLCSLKKNENNQSNSKLMKVDYYIERLKDFLANNDFYEFGTVYKIMKYENICFVYNEYQAFEDKNKTHFKKKGINLITLLFDGLEWKIVSMLWEDKLD